MIKEEILDSMSLNFRNIFSYENLLIHLNALK
jgi:hypothetical protein